MGVELSQAMRHTLLQAEFVKGQGWVIYTTQVRTLQALQARGLVMQIRKMQAKKDPRYFALVTYEGQQVFSDHLRRIREKPGYGERYQFYSYNRYSPTKGD